MTLCADCKAYVETVRFDCTQCGATRCARCDAAARDRKVPCAKPPEEVLLLARKQSKAQAKAAKAKAAEAKDKDKAKAKGNKGDEGDEGNKGDKGEIVAKAKVEEPEPRLCMVAKVARTMPVAQAAEARARSVVEVEALKKAKATKAEAARKEAAALKLEQQQQRKQQQQQRKEQQELRKLQQELRKQQHKQLHQKRAATVTVLKADAPAFVPAFLRSSPSPSPSSSSSASSPPDCGK